MTLSDKPAIRAKIYLALPVCSGKEALTCTVEEPSPTCKKAVDKITALLSQVERDSRIDENKQWLEFDHELMGEVSKRIAKLQSLEPGREATDGRN